MTSRLQNANTVFCVLLGPCYSILPPQLKTGTQNETDNLYKSAYLVTGREGGMNEDKHMEVLGCFDTLS